MEITHDTTTSAVLDAAEKAWQAWAAMRSRRLRLKRYAFGDQWSDPVTGDNGITVTERRALQLGGHDPKTHNIIRQLVKSLVGYYRTSPHEVTQVDGEVAAANNLAEIDARQFEEFLISGCAVQRMSHQRRPRGDGPWADIVSPARFFSSYTEHLLGDDIELVGQLLDLTMHQVVMRWAHGDPARAARLKAIYGCDADEIALSAFGPDAMQGTAASDNIHFRRAHSRRCRVIEVWTLESIERYRCYDPVDGSLSHIPLSDGARVTALNRSRKAEGRPPVVMRYDAGLMWRGRFIAPTGELLDIIESDRHPFVMKFYPLLDGEIHPFVEDLVDPQRNVNRLLTLNDRIVATAAKGVLLFPENQSSATMTIEEAARNWTAPDGVVLYQAKLGLPGPQQVVSSPGNLGISSMLGVQMQLVEEISGLSAPLRGQSAHGVSAASLYEAQQRHSATALADLFGSYEAFVDMRNRRLNSLVNKI